jgi:hypothetical protein
VLLVRSLSVEIAIVPTSMWKITSDTQIIITSLLAMCEGRLSLQHDLLDRSSTFGAAIRLLRTLIKGSSRSLAPSVNPLLGIFLTGLSKELFSKLENRFRHPIFISDFLNHHFTILMFLIIVLCQYVLIPSPCAEVSKAPPN